MDLLPDEYFKNAGVTVPSAADRLRSFSTNTLQLITEKGSNLFAELVLAEPRMRIDRTTPYSNMINPYTGRLANKPPVVVSGRDAGGLEALCMMDSLSRPRHASKGFPWRRLGFAPRPMAFIHPG